jgi:hypothetical protein
MAYTNTTPAGYVKYVAGYQPQTPAQSVVWSTNTRSTNNDIQSMSEEEYNRYKRRWEAANEAQNEKLRPIQLASSQYGADVGSLSSREALDKLYDLDVRKDWRKQQSAMDAKYEQEQWWAQKNQRELDLMRSQQMNKDEREQFEIDTRGTINLSPAQKRLFKDYKSGKISYDDYLNLLDRANYDPATAEAKIQDRQNKRENEARAKSIQMEDEARAKSIKMEDEARAKSDFESKRKSDFEAQKDLESKRKSDFDNYWKSTQSYPRREKIESSVPKFGFDEEFINRNRSR